jgi:PAS domain S-box-containing protein
MNVSYLLPPLIQTVLSFALIVVVLRARPQTSLHRLFSLYLLGLALWGITVFGMRASPDVEHAYRWERGLMVLSPLISVLLYHFSIQYAGVRTKKWVLPFIYVIGFLSLPLATTGIIISGMQLATYGYAPIFGLVFPAWIFFNYLLFILALVNFVRTWRGSYYAEERNRAAFIVIGVFASLVGGVFDILPALGLPLYPGLIIGNTIFCVLTTVAIVKHRLLDIHVVLRKSTSYLLTSFLIAIPFIIFFVMVNYFFTQQGFPFWGYFIFIIILAILWRPLWEIVQKRVNQWFYRERYDYLRALETFSQQTQRLTDFAALGSNMVNLLAKALRSPNIYLLQALPSGDDFIKVFSTGVNNPNYIVRLGRQGALVKWLERSQSMLSYEDVEIIPQLQSITSQEKGTLEQIGAKLVVPLNTPTGQLSWILILGKKLSEQHYTVEDKQLIHTICNQMSINLENARLYRASQHEVAERKRMEEALQESQEKLRQVFDSATDGISVINLKGIIIEVNQRTVEMHRFGSREELLGKSAFELVAPRDRERIAKNMRQASKHGSMMGVEYTLLRADGSEFPGELSTSALKDASGNLVGHVSIARDITERKQAEEREKALQRELYLSSRLASIGELAAGVAHQLNNPLTGILGFSQRILRKVTDQETSQDLRKVYGEAERAAKIVQNLLTFARRRQPKKEYSDVNNVVQSALELRAYELKTSNIEVITNLAPILPKIMLDFHQIQEVFLNLILNAEQAMTEANSGGKLTILTKKNKGYVRCTFSDDGPGIPPENLDNIFNPFFTTKGEIGGTGLGLSVCHGIIGEHGGKIYAKSKPSKGATFFVELPITAKE